MLVRKRGEKFYLCASQYFPVQASYSGGGTRSVVYLLIGMLLLGQCFSRSVQVTGFLERCLIVRLLFGLKNT